MTREEAGEVILENEPWMPCPKCDAIDSSNCSRCAGYGNILDPRWIEASVLLDGESPPNPPVRSVTVRVPGQNFPAHVRFSENVVKRRLSGYD